MAVRPSKRATLARRETALVIDGFLRSGNTFSVAAFVVANGPDHHLGRHLHGAPHLLRAVRLGLPAVLLIRRPADAVASYLVRRPTLHPYDAVLEYLDVYRTAWPVRDRVVVGVFEQVVSDFGAIVEAVNEKFGTSFAPYVPTPENEAAAFALVEEMNRRECRGEVVETHVGRPSAAREEQKQRVTELMRGPRVQALFDEADALFGRWAALAPPARADRGGPGAPS